MPRLASLFVWGMGCSCLVAPSAADCLSLASDPGSTYSYAGSATNAFDDCIFIQSSVPSLAKFAFKMTDLNEMTVDYSASQLSLQLGALQQAGPLVVQMVCESGCGNGAGAACSGGAAAAAGIGLVGAIGPS